MSLVNDLLKFTSSDTQICWIFFAEKNVSSFCSVQKLLTFFQQNNVRILYIKSAITVNEMIFNEPVKLTTLWTNRPWLLSFSFCYVCAIFVIVCLLFLLVSLVGIILWTRGKKRIPLRMDAFSKGRQTIFKDLPYQKVYNRNKRLRRFASCSLAVMFEDYSSSFFFIFACFIWRPQSVV